MTQHPGSTAFIAARVQRGWHSQTDVAEAYARHARTLGETATITV
ncbi:hypothetical protein [Streptomyces triculaminicus]